MTTVGKMKIILSRKGFDSSYGGMPSPILPDGTMLSLPIPSMNDYDKYTDLRYEDKSLFDIIVELKPKTKIKPTYTCHYDPMISNLRSFDSFLPLFGQKDQSLSHLINQGVGRNDIFLFFGWFRETEFFGNKLRFKADAPDIHALFGCLTVKDMYCGLFPESLNHHPHYKYQTVPNCIYLGDPSRSGAFRFSDDIVLTKKGFLRSQWSLPDFFKSISITYHTKKSFHDGYFDSAKKGQEFVIEENCKVSDWANGLINRHLMRKN